METAPLDAVVQSRPDVMGGVPVFAGTRVPALALVDYLAGGHTLDAFLDDFPTVTREQAVALLNAFAAEVARGARTV